MQACLYTLLLLLFDKCHIIFFVCFKVSTLKHIFFNFQNYVNFKECKVYIYTFVHQNAMPSETFDVQKRAGSLSSLISLTQNTVLANDKQNYQLVTI